MDSLLSPAFDNISSSESTRIRKGLRQIEGLLAQICLPNGSPKKHHRASSLASTNADIPQAEEDHPPPSLRNLPSDPAFLAFFRLQESFEWNIISRLLPTLEKLLSQPSTSPIDALATHALALLHALLLLHPPSRHLLASPPAMTLLLDLTDLPTAEGASAALRALMAALLGCPRNARAFERVDGLATVTALFRARETPQEVKLQALEFLYFYLMPERAGDSVVASRGGGDGAAGMEGGGGSGKSSRSAGSAGSAGSGRSSGSNGSALSIDKDRDTRTVKEKQKLLGRYLSNVEDLVQDLRDSVPFGAVAVP